jgi:hypothetical protein
MCAKRNADTGRKENGGRTPPSQITAQAVSFNS